MLTQKFYIKSYKERLFYNQRSILLTAVDENGKEYSIEGGKLDDDSRLV